MADTNPISAANEKIASTAPDWFFKTDQVRLYTITPFKEAGFGVPSFGSRCFTANRPLWSLAHEIGQIQLLVMSNVDARRSAYPSLNTVMRICKAINRVFTVLLGRMKTSADLRLDEGKGSPVPLAWLMHPVPYFNGDFVRNAWLQQYNELTMIALANLMQHNDNELSLTITAECAQALLNYFQEIKFLIGGELLGMTKATLTPQTYVFDDASFAGYATIASRVTSLEVVDAGTDARAGFTENDLKPLFTGIPSDLILPNLGLFPVVPTDNAPQPDGDLSVQQTTKNVTDGAIKPVV